MLLFMRIFSLLLLFVVEAGAAAGWEGAAIFSRFDSIAVKDMTKTLAI